MDVTDIQQFIFHQASGMIVGAVAERLAIPAEKTFRNFATRGNMTSASVAVALSEAVAAGRIRTGDVVCLVATGGGFSAGVTIMRWEI
jgi:3-oxoacyl-[acyl-carrier-protein] synthase-3